MGKPKNVVPMTLSVPKELKAKMEAVTQPPNWSAVASEAFQAKVLQLASETEGTRMVDGMVARLRAAAELEANRDYQDGLQVGEQWAADKATPRQLRCLQALVDNPKCSLSDWLNYVAADGMTKELMNELADNPEVAPKLAAAGSLPYSGSMKTGIGRGLHWSLFPNKVADQNEVESFWMVTLGRQSRAIENHDFARGFVEGALAMWQKVRGKL